MNMKYVIYLLISIATCWLLVSCDGDEGSFAKSFEGYWVFTERQVEIKVTDSNLEEKIQEYISNRADSIQSSYEFKNDKTYYYYLNHSDPVKGIYKILDNNYMMIDDARGIKTVACEDSLIFVISDLKNEVVRELNLDKSKVIKVNITSTFERGLFSN